MKTQDNQTKNARHPKSRTPFRIELKFTAEEWERLGDLGTERGRSRYNYVKHIALNPDGDWEHHFKAASAEMQTRLAKGERLTL